MKLEHKRLVSLRYCMYKADLEKELNHPQKVMRSLGIKYEHATPMSVGGMWVFWLCSIPSGVELPSYLTEFKTPISEMVGFGLSKEMADKLIVIENDGDMDERIILVRDSLSTFRNQENKQ